MSYNNIKVSSRDADSNGNVSLNIGDVSSITNTTDNQTLTHNGTNWVNKNPDWVNEYEESSRTNIVNSSFTLNSDIPIPRTNLPSGEQYFWAFGANRINSVNYLTSTNTSNSTITYANLSSNSRWNYKVVLNNPGLYRLWAKLPIGPSSSTNSSLEVQWSNTDNTITYSPKFRMHRYDMKQVYAIGYINAIGGESVGLYAHSNNNNAKNPNNYSNHLITIEKLS
jgi:hypothetical protein